MQAGKHPQSQHSEEARGPGVQGALGEGGQGQPGLQETLSQKGETGDSVARAFQLVLQNLLPIVALKCWDTDKHHWVQLAFLSN